jgi:hypothetical protein
MNMNTQNASDPMNINNHLPGATSQTPSAKNQVNRKNQSLSERIPCLTKPFNRKAVSGTVIFLILFIVVIVVYFSFTGVWNEVLKRMGGERGCQLSFLAASTTNINVGVASKSFFDIHCDRKRETIWRSSVYTNGAIDPEKVKRALAEEVRVCWGMTGEGQLNPFGTSQLIVDKRHCVICTVVRFDSKIIKELNTDQKKLTIDGLGEYFKETEMGPGSYGNPEWTYGQYLTRDKKTADLGSKDRSYFLDHAPSEKQFIDAKTSIIVGNQNDQYLIVYVYDRAALGVTALRDDANSVAIVPAQDLGKLECDRTWN